MLKTRIICELHFDPDQVERAIKAEKRWIAVPVKRPLATILIYAALRNETKVCGVEYAHLVRRRP